MRKYRYDVTICPDNSPQAFKTTCAKIEKAFPYLVKEKLLVDVDGSTIQVYSKNGKEVVIYDDYDEGAVFALADYDIRNALK